MNKWPIAALGDVVSLRRDRVRLFPGKDYKRLTVRLGGKGVVLRDEVDGAVIKSEVQFAARAGQFIASKIDARNGAFGLVPRDLDDSVVSANFLTFDCAPNRLDPKFLEYYVRRPAFWGECAGISEGTTNRVPIRLEDFLRLTMPLPELSVQARLVGRIEAIANRIREAEALCQLAAEQSSALLETKAALVFRAAVERGTVPLDSIADLARGKFSHRPRNDPRFFGGSHPWIQIAEIESAGKIISRWTQTLNDEGLAVSKKFPKGTVLISIAATIGSVGILGFDCCVPDSIVGVTPRGDAADSEFLYYYLSYLRGHLEDVAPQSAQKNINLEILSPLPFPRLTHGEQRNVVAQLDELQAEVDCLQTLQRESREEIASLLPSILEHAFGGGFTD